AEPERLQLPAARDRHALARPAGAGGGAARRDRARSARAVLPAEAAPPQRPRDARGGAGALEPSAARLPLAVAVHPARGAHGSHPPADGLAARPCAAAVPTLAG